MANNEYVLAMYDVRGKQEYIYNNPKIKQIAGASWIIRDCFSTYLFDAAAKISVNGIYNYPPGKDFGVNNFEDHLNDGYIGEVIYDGGGNFFVLYKDLTCYQETNKIFSRKLMEDTYTLRVLTSYIIGVDFENYKSDIQKVRDKHRKAEQRESISYPVNALPIVQVDYFSSLPLTHYEKSVENKVSTESYAKYKKYNDIKIKDNKNGIVNSVEMLDDLIEEKGKDSHLAVIYIDGNGMGAKIEEINKKNTSYEDSINSLRRFSAEIEEQYITIPKTRIENDYKKEYRFVVSAGDEITFICNAKHAYEIVQSYFESVKDSNKNNSSCAGIAIFKSHAPFAEAYRIAEECCETGKKIMKQQNITNACFMDFHYCQGAIGTSLENIREHEGTTEFSVPWLLYESDQTKELKAPRKDVIHQIAKILNIIARSNSKTLLNAAKESETIYKTEIERIFAHLSDSDKAKLEESEIMYNQRESKPLLLDNRELVYRIMLIFDLWFREGK